MKIKIYGKNYFKGETKRGRHMDGTFIHTLVNDQYVEGEKATSYFVDSSICLTSDLIIGAVYDVYFNDRGGIDYICPVK